MKGSMVSFAQRPPTKITRAEWLHCLEWFNWRCAYCGSPRGLWIVISKDHFIPLSNGGKDNVKNVVPSCWGEGCCNNKKHNKEPVQWLIKTFGQNKAASRIAAIQDYFGSLPSCIEVSVYDDTATMETKRVKSERRRERRGQYYILDGQDVKAVGYLEMHDWIKEHDRTIMRTVIDDVEIVTRFIGEDCDYAYNYPEPTPFVTRTSNQWFFDQYSNLLEAQIGHDSIVALIEGIKAEREAK